MTLLRRFRRFLAHMLGVPIPSEVFVPGIHDRRRRRDRPIPRGLLYGVDRDADPTGYRSIAQAADDGLPCDPDWPWCHACAAGRPYPRRRA